MSRVERVKQLIDEQFSGNQAEFARTIGKAAAQVNQWLNGYRNIGDGMARHIEDCFDKNKGWLDGVLPQPLPKTDEVKDIHKPRLWSSNDPLPEDEYVFAPYLKDFEMAGGAGSFENPDYNNFRLPFGKSTLYRKCIQPENVFCCTLTGDSMEDRIPEDAAIAIDRGATQIRDGKIYAFRHDDMFRVKYLLRQPGGTVIIRSENSYYQDEIAHLEDIEVIGRVFWWSVLD